MSICGSLKNHNDKKTSNRLRHLLTNQAHLLQYNHLSRSIEIETKYTELSRVDEVDAYNKEEKKKKKKLYKVTLKWVEKAKTFGGSK